jgi:hypothetical protein
VWGCILFDLGPPRGDVHTHEEIEVTLREIQEPIKTRYRDEPGAARVTLRATGAMADGAMSCSVDIGRALYAAAAHPGVGGAGGAACSGDLLLGALAACAQLTCQMVAANMGLDDRLKRHADADANWHLGRQRASPGRRVGRPPRRRA